MTHQGGTRFGTSDIVRNQPSNISVNVSRSAILDAWVDFNNDGDFTDGGEQVFTNQIVAAGSNSLAISVPGAASIGATFARFRVSSTEGGVTGPIGDAPDGEVEDYRITVVGVKTVDFGDAPASYGTLLADDGARHVTSGIPLHLGSLRDDEDDATPGEAAAGDDNTGVDDEDGVRHLSDAAFGSEGLVTSQPASIKVNASATSVLDAWVDFNGDGDFTDGDEQVFTNQPLIAGDNPLAINVPASAEQGETYARFRVSQTSAGVTSPIGEAPDGEVEDYLVSVVPQPIVAGVVFSEDFQGNAASAERKFTERVGDFRVINNRIEVTPDVNQDPVATFDLPGTISGDLRIDADVDAGRRAGGRFSNALVVFDYEDPKNFKVAGLTVFLNRAVIGQVDNGQFRTLRSRSVNIDSDTSYALSVTIQNGRDVTLSSQTGRFSSITHRFGR